MLIHEGRFFPIEDSGEAGIEAAAADTITEAEIGADDAALTPSPESQDADELIVPLAQVAEEDDITCEEVQPDDGPTAAAVTDSGQTAEFAGAMVTGQIAEPMAAIPPEDEPGEPPVQKGVVETPDEDPAPSTEGQGGGAQPPSDEVLPTGGEGDDEGGENDDATAETSEPSESEHTEALIEGSARFDATLAAMFRHKNELEEAHPTFKVVTHEQAAPEVTIFHDQLPEGGVAQPDEPPQRVAFSLENPECKVSVPEETPGSSESDAEPDGEDNEIAEQQPTVMERPLTTANILEEMRKVAPEPDAIGFQEPELAEALVCSEPRQIRTIPLASEDEHFATITVLGKAPLEPFGGAVTKKSLIDARVDRTGERTSYVERPYNSNYIDVWSRCREAGLPVVPELHITEEDKLLTADLKADGSELYGKALWYTCKTLERDSRDVPHERDRPRTDVDERFFDLMETSRESIMMAANIYTGLASQQSMELPFDDPFELVVHPNGSWDLAIVDLNEVRIDEEASFYEIHAKNGRHVSRFLDRLNQTAIMLRIQRYASE